MSGRSAGSHDPRWVQRLVARLSRAERRAYEEVIRTYEKPDTVTKARIAERVMLEFRTGGKSHA